MHVRDANATLHDLEDLALLQDGDVVFGRFGFVLFALHEEWFWGLAVYAAVKQVLMASCNFAHEAEASD